MGVSGAAADTLFRRIDPGVPNERGYPGPGIVGAGVKMEYILFDDCYMSSVKAAYELREATRFLIASASEMMAYGMLYATVGSSCWEILITDPFAKDSTTFIQPMK